MDRGYVNKKIVSTITRVKFICDRTLYMGLRCRLSHIERLVCMKPQIIEDLRT